MKAIEKLFIYTSFFFLTVVSLLVILYKNKIDWMYESAHIYPNGIMVYGCVLAGLFLLYFFGKTISGISEKAILISGMIICLIIGICLMFFTSYTPFGDDSLCLSSAFALRDNDYSPLATGGYLFRFPHQVGMIVYDYLLSFISRDYHFYYLVNLIWILLELYYLWKLMYVSVPEQENIRKWAIVLYILFLPQVFYILFIYGVTPGNCWMTVALYNLVAYIKTERKINAIGCVLMTGAFSLIRQNLIIAAIAMIMIMFFIGVTRKKIRYLIIVSGIVLAVVFPRMLLLFGVERLTGMELSSGAPTSLCIAMGLQEKGDEITSRPNGWFNGYSFHVFEENDYDYDASNAVAVKEIKSRINYMIGNPRYAYAFFKEKLISGWCDPTFQCITSGPRKSATGEAKGYILNSLYGNGTVYSVFITAMDIWLIMVFAFSWMHFFKILFIKNEELRPETGYAILFLTGIFIFHFFWEMMGKYVFPAVYIMIIPAAFGINSFVNIRGNRYNDQNQK